MAKALYRKWRPKDWDEVVAQEHVIQTLRNAVVHDRVAHAYLFAGPRGTGKTTSARLLAKALNCLEPDLEKRPCNKCEHCLALNQGRFMDLIEIDAASNTSVDDVRDLREKINFSPSQGKFKVYIIDEVHMLSTAAFNALLKTLEEPPPHAIFILATTEIHKIPATVLSRCQQHEFRRIPVNVIVDHLKAKSKEENIQVEDPVFVEIARQATGSLRDAISLLDQLTSSDEKITLKMAQQVLGTATDTRVIEIVDALIEKDTSQGLTQINKALDSGTDPRQLARQIVSYLRNVLLFKMNNEGQVEVAEDVRANIHEHAGKMSMPDLLKAIEAFNQATIDEHANWHPGLGLELAFTTFLIQPEVPITPARQPEPVAVKTQNPAVKSRQPVKQPPSQSAPAKATQSKQPAQTPKKKTIEEKPKQEVQDSEPAEIEPIAIAQPGGDISLNDIHRAWDAIKAKVRQHNPRTEGILNSAKIAGMSENTLVLGFASEMVKGFMEKEGNLNLTNDILQEVLGKPIIVKCIVSTNQSSALPDDLEFDKDGMVSTATRDLGGKISKAEEAE